MHFDDMSDEQTFDFTYQGSRLEAEYLRESLAEFIDDRWITDVLFKVKGGKEANVYCCRAGEGAGAELVALKVYRPRMFRAMHNDWIYKQGRVARDPEGKAVYRGKDLRLAQRSSRLAQKVNIASWCQFEYDVLQRMQAAGADVPRVHALGQNSIVMEYIGGAAGGAPVLHGIHLPRPRAHELFEQLVRNVEIALQNGLIHADLSAHNVLWWDDRPFIIDWPQAVKTDSHPQAFELFHRDLDRLCRYFSRQGVECDAMEITDRLWRAR